jgi:hypothetical protein
MEFADRKVGRLRERVGWEARSPRSGVGKAIHAGGDFAEASLPGMPGFDLPHRQKALGGDTLVRHNAEQLTGWKMRIFHEQFEIVTRGKAISRLPRANGGNRNTQILGDYLKGNLVLPPPVAEGECKAGSDVTVKLRLFGHGTSLRGVYVSGKEISRQTRVQCVKRCIWRRSLRFEVACGWLNLAFRYRRRGDCGGRTANVILFPAASGPDPQVVW